MLLEALKYTNLKQLDISNNPLGLRGAEFLGKILLTSFSSKVNKNVIVFSIDTIFVK